MSAAACHGSLLHFVQWKFWTLECRKGKSYGVGHVYERKV